MVVVVVSIAHCPLKARHHVSKRPHTVRAGSLDPPDLIEPSGALPGPAGYEPSCTVLLRLVYRHSSTEEHQYVLCTSTKLNRGMSENCTEARRVYRRIS